MQQTIRSYALKKICLLITAAIALIACPATVPHLFSDLAGFACFAGSAEPDRILSIAPAATEILYDLGLGDRVAGVTKYCTWPPEAAAKPQISDMMDLNMEVVASLKPDIAVISNMNEHLKARLLRFGIKVLVVNQDNFAQICDSMLDVGKACGVEETASRRIDELKRSVRELSEQARDLAGRGNGEKQRVLVVVGRDMSDPSFKKVYVAGTASFYNDLLRESGASNAVDLDVQYLNLSREGLLRIDPDMVIELLGEHGNTTYEVSDAAAQWRSFEDLRAGREGNVAHLKGDFALRASPRYPAILDAFIRTIHLGERAVLE